MTRSLIAVLADRRGVTAAEYAALAVGLVLAVAVGAKAFGVSVSTALAGIAFT